MHHLHVKISTILGQWHMLQSSTGGLAHKLPWDQVAVMLCHAQKHLQAHSLSAPTEVQNRHFQH